MGSVIEKERQAAGHSCGMHPLRPLCQVKPRNAHCDG